MSTMREVAQHAGVSAKTVSRVMHNDRYVSADVRQRVEQAIRDLQYVPNVLARTFRSGRDDAIGVAIPDISDPFFATLTHEVERVARSRGVAVFVTSLGDDGADERPGVEALLSRQVFGLITTPTSSDQSYLRRWQDRTTIVFIDRPPARITADSVVEDDFGGAYTATSHLIGHGHRRIGFIGDRPTTATTARRLDGYRAALAETGVPEDPRLIGLDAGSGAAAGRMALDLLAQPDPPTALFSSNAQCSIGIVPALQSSGRGGMPFISFGDFPLADALQPPLSVIDQDPVAVGHTAVTRIFERRDHPNRRLRRRIVLPVRLLTRGSCGGDHVPELAEPAASEVSVDRLAASEV